jgi:hypothetical protein
MILEATLYNNSSAKYITILISCLLDEIDFIGIFTMKDCLCGLVVRVPGYKSRGPGYQIF